MNNPIVRKLPFFYGWVVIATAFVTMAIAVNARTSFSLLFPAILDEFGWNRGMTAGAFSVGFVASAIIIPVVGMMMDRWSPRVVIPIGATMVIAGLIGAMYVSTPLGIYATLGVLVVSGSIAMSYITHSMFLPNWFVKRRGLAIGIAFSGVGVGSILLLPWIGRIIDGAGWRQACFTMAVAVAVIVPLNFFLQRKRPEDMGLEPDGEGRQGARSGTPSPDPVVDRAWAETNWTPRLAVRTGRFWWIAIAYFTGMFVWYSVLVHQTAYLIEVGFDSGTAAMALGLVGLFGIAGQIGIGALSDRIGREWAWTIGLGGFAASYGALILLADGPSLTWLYVMIMTQGCIGFGLASIFGAITAEIFAGPRYATIFGMTSLAGNLGAGAGPWITGYIYDSAGSYVPAFWLCIAMAVVSSIAVWLAAPRKVRLVAGRAKRLKVDS